MSNRRNKRRHGGKPQGDQQGPRNYRDPFNKRFMKFFASVSTASCGYDVSPRTYHMLKRLSVEA